MPNIKTLIFDLGKVIIAFDWKRGYAAMAPYCGCTPEEIPERMGGHELLLELETGHMGEHAFYEEFGRRIGFSGTYDQFEECWGAIFFPETLIPESFFLAAKEKYRLLLLSNTNGIHIDLVKKRYPLIHHFDYLVLSHEAKAMKPSPAIYEIALANAQAEPRECFFTDDIAVNIESAREAGIDAELFTGYSDLLNHLQARSVLLP